MAIQRGESIRVQGLSELRKALAQLDAEDSTEWRKELAQANFDVAQFVVQRAKPQMAALGGMGSRAAKTMTASRSGVASRLSLGGPKAPFAEGVEFGAKQNLRRIIKNTRGRATIVRDEEDIDRVIGRVEATSIEAGSRKQSLKQFRGKGDVMAVRAQRVMRGWNQFRPWRGNDANAGYALYPTMRSNQEQIIEFYGDAVDRIMDQAFPD